MILKEKLFQQLQLTKEKHLTFNSNTTLRSGIENFDNIVNLIFMSKMEVLRLYKTLLRESQKFPSYNYRNYFIRRIQDAFRANKTIASKEEVSKEISRANTSLNVIKRQVIVGQLYQTHKLVIENIPVPVRTS